LELEDDEKRRERRIKNQPTVPGVGICQLPPNKSGAMDALLEKLKKAGPAVRQRRRDQYKGRNGRTASGTRTVSSQSIPGEPTSGGESASPEMPLTPMTLPVIEATEEENSLTSRSQEILMRLREENSGDGAASGTAGSLRVRRRRASGDDVRRERRRRQGSNVSASGTDAALEGEDTENQDEMIAKAKLALMNMRRGSEADVEEDAAAGMPTPTTIVSPPSPKLEKAEPVVAAPE
jgi:cytokinesis protein